MATETATLPRDRQIAVSPTDPLAAAVRVVTGWIRRKQQVRRTVALLSTLDDHLLADIGLLRDQVEQAARGDYAPVRCFGGGNGG